jgi:hypothetical protein
MARRNQTSIRTAIRSYGLIWHRDGVLWGRSGTKGRLAGRRSRRIVDFRLQVGVYVLYDETRRPIYVGQAGQGRARLFNRLRSHTRDNLALAP